MLMKKHLEGKTLWDIASGIGQVLIKIQGIASEYYTSDAVKEQNMLRTIDIRTRYWEDNNL
jgi:ubiquinone/menaquinone biosynthesis C-methylase UbiE